MAHPKPPAAPSKAPAPADPTAETQPLPLPRAFAADDEDEDEPTVADQAYSGPSLRPERRDDRTDPDARRPAPPPAPARRTTHAAMPRPKAGLLPGAPAPAPGLPKVGDAADEDDDEPVVTIVNGSSIDLLCAGPKAGLKPVFDAIVEASRRLGHGVVVTVKPTHVVLSHKRDFAALMASPGGDRVDLGLFLPARPPTRRLARARVGAWAEGLTHTVVLRYRTEIDTEIRGWLSEAYWACR